MTSAVTACDPANPWLSQPARIQRVTPEAPGVATYDLVFEDPAVARTFAFRPGQFNMLYLPGVGEAAISISGDPADSSKVPHTIRSAGNVTHTLAELGPGAGIGVRGPFGSGWPLDVEKGTHLILVAGGIGFAPLRPAVYELLRRRNHFGSLTILLGARNPDGLLYSAEFEAWRGQGIDVQCTVDRAAEGWSGQVGVVTTLLDRLRLDEPHRTRILTCGPEVMMWYTVQTALRRGIPREQIFVSLERNMNCAIGLCGHCQFGPEFVCRDGPVFPFDRVASILKVHDL